MLSHPTPPPPPPSSFLPPPPFPPVLYQHFPLQSILLMVQVLPGSDTIAPFCLVRARKPAGPHKAGPRVQRVPGEVARVPSLVRAETPASQALGPAAYLIVELVVVKPEQPKCKLIVAPVEHRVSDCVPFSSPFHHPLAAAWRLVSVASLGDWFGRV